MASENHPSRHEVAATTFGRHALRSDPGLHQPAAVGHPPLAARTPAVSRAGPWAPKSSIGVNTSIHSPSGASAGIGFAIPVDEVNRIVPSLIRDGRLVRPALGLSGAGPELNRALGLPKDVAIVQLQRSGPAAKAALRAFTRGETGIVAGDVITAVESEPVETMDDLLTALERLQPGQSCTLTLWRAGSTRRQTVTLAESED